MDYPVKRSIILKGLKHFILFLLFNTMWERSIIPERIETSTDPGRGSALVRTFRNLKVEAEHYTGYISPKAHMEQPNPKKRIETMLHDKDYLNQTAWERSIIWKGLKHSTYFPPFQCQCRTFHNPWRVGTNYCDPGRGALLWERSMSWKVETETPRYVLSSCENIP